MTGMTREVASFLNDCYKNRRLIVKLTQRDFRIRYARNRLGLMWAVLEPLALLVIMLIVFTYLRTRSHPDYPFVVFLLSGLVGYNFFSSSLMQATKSIQSFSFMINLVHIRTSFLPLISILSSFRTHLIILCVAILILLYKGVGFSFYWFQLIYFMAATWLLLTGLSWLTSAINIFVPDLQHILTIGMRAMFFLTPIFWDISIFPERFHNLLKLNPLYYIVEGYRMSLLYHKPFWSDGFAMVSFWSFTIILLFTGAWVFRRLKPYFADVTH